MNSRIKGTYGTHSKFDVADDEFSKSDDFGLSYLSRIQLTEMLDDALRGGRRRISREGISRTAVIPLKFGAALNSGFVSGV